MEPVTSTRARRLLRLTRVVAFGLLAALALRAVVSDGAPGSFGAWVYAALILVAAASCLTRGLAAAPGRAPWLLLGAGLVAWGAAEIADTAYLSRLAEPPYPSLADALWLAFYPASYLALVMLVRGRISGRRRLTVWIDGLVAALAVAAVGEVLLARPIAEMGAGGGSLQMAADLAYPLCDLLLIALVFGMFAITGWRPGRSWTLIGLGLTVAVAADCIHAFGSGTGALDGTAVDALWPAAMLLLGWAAWEPAGGAIEVRPSGWRVLLLPVAFALTALGVLVYDHFNPVDDLAMVLAALTLLAVIVRTALTFGENLSMLAFSRREALTDALTGLGNRRRLMTDLLREIDEATAEHPRALILFDLDGFKRYNDSFGHPAGDSLLARLGRNLAAAVAPWGRAYRLGGDEFCALVGVADVQLEAVVDATSAALSERGRGFEVGASHGIALLPGEAGDPSVAMQIADQRLYGNKGARRREAVGQQTRDVLIQVLHERQPGLHQHLHEVAALALGVGRELSLLPEELDEMARAAELHDVGKMAIPDVILDKPGPLDPVELDFIRQHTLVGERIIAAAPSLAPVARLVRASHENWDGSGYPDGLAGEAIPLAARIIAACDAFHTMTTDRAYQAAITPDRAIAELRRCAGANFDPDVVEVLCAQLESGAAPIPAAAPPAPAPDRGDPAPLDPELPADLDGRLSLG